MFGEFYSSLRGVKILFGLPDGANSFRVEGKAVKYILSRISGDFRCRSTLWFDIRSSSFTLVVFFSVLKIESPLVEYRWQVNHLVNIVKKKKSMFPCCL